MFASGYVKCLPNVVLLDYIYVICYIIQAMIIENLYSVKERIKRAALKAGKSTELINLVCVTKKASIDQMKEVIEAGVTDIGENRVQDALKKYRQLGYLARMVRWHMIGHLQTNKVKKALEIFDVIHSLDSLKLAKEIDIAASNLGKKIDVFVEVNISGEESKYGVKDKELFYFIKLLKQFDRINILGLMTMAPYTKDSKDARYIFRRLKKLQDNLKKCRILSADTKELSMGMSQDFEVAVEEGATYVRIGSAIFD